MTEIKKIEGHNFTVLPDNTISLVPLSGVRIDRCLDAAKEIAISHGTDVTVTFNFNDRQIRVKHDSDLNLIMRDFWRGDSHVGPVGPYPCPVDTEEDKAAALERGGVIIVDLQ